jgi:zinc protease
VPSGARAARKRLLSSVGPPEARQTEILRTMEVQTVTSPGGIKAWLVEDSAEPMFSLRFSFEGGSAQDPAGKEGVANFVAMMLQQGAGHLSAVAFEQEIEELAVNITLGVTPDAVNGAIDALSETRVEAGRLVGLALNTPRFDADAVERVRGRLVTFDRGEARRPVLVAEFQWNATAFPGHAYARKVAGSETSANAITTEDLRDYHRRVFARDNLTVVAVGDITATELGQLVDLLFGNLPANANHIEVPAISPVAGGRLRVAEIDVPQSVVAFGLGDVAYASPDYYPAWVLAHILGGHSLGSRLGRELRGKRGLAHSAGSWLEHRQHAAVFRGRFSTRNEMVATSIEVLRQELQQMADGVLTEKELEDAKSYILGSFDLSLGSHGTIAQMLLGSARMGFGADILERRQAMMAAVTIRDLKRVAKQLLDPDNLIISIAGTPALQPARTS